MYFFKEPDISMIYLVYKWWSG